MLGLNKIYNVDCLEKIKEIDNLVLDTICDSRTTCKMAKVNNRNFIGIKILEEYCKIAEKRLSKLTINEDYLRINNFI